MTNKQIAVKVHSISKSFRIPLEGSTGIKQKLINHLKGRAGYREFTPLNHISFEIEKGDFFGIVGRNGSGKSTLLKTIAGIYTPDRGRVEVAGKLVPFIELGVGFNPELTGRENVFLNGALLGFSRAEMNEMYDEIVDFAELHDFMEERLKNYSSGMQVRLAFSIAIRANGDILLLDEVLAVGDEAFQRKCNDYFNTLKKNKRTVILVTHSMEAVQRFCNRALFLKDGNIAAIGSPRKIADQYTHDNEDSYAISMEHQKEHESIADETNFKLLIKNGHGNENVPRFIQNEKLKVSLSWETEGVKHAGVAIIDELGRDVFSPNTFKEMRQPLSRKSVDYEVVLNIAPGKYTLKAALFGDNDSDVLAREIDGIDFIVDKDFDKIDYVGITRLEHTWHEEA